MSFCPHFPKSDVQNVKSLNPWGKRLEQVVSDLKTFGHKGCKIAAQKQKQKSSVNVGLINQ